MRSIAQIFKDIDDVRKLSDRIESLTSISRIDCGLISNTLIGQGRREFSDDELNELVITYLLMQ